MNSYIYGALPDHKDAIRLLLLFPFSSDENEDLRCELTDSRLSDPNATFTALSYARGEVQQNHSLNVNDHEVKIGENLQSALRDIRRKDRVIHLWVDALCINEADIPEKNRQVRIMRDVYLVAQETVIYLGEDNGSNTSVSAWSFLERNSEWAMNLDGDRDFDLPGIREKEVHFRGGFDDVEIDVLSRPWFRRWMLPEAIVSGNLTIQCGRRKIPWNSFAKTILETPRQLSQYPARNWQWANKIESIQRIQFFRALYHQTTHDVSSQQEKRGSGLDGLDLLARMKALEAVDPRDKIFTLLGLVSNDDGEDDEPIIDYSKSYREVYMHFAKLSIQAGCFDILSYVQKGPSSHYINHFENEHYVCPCIGSDGESSTIKLPSWTPNWWGGFDSDRMSIISFVPKSKNDSLRDRDLRSSSAASQTPRKKICASNYKPQRLTILDPASEDEATRSRRQRIVRENHSFANDTTQSLACNGTILGTIDLLSPQIFLNKQAEDEFQALRDKYSQDRKACYNAIMQDWQRILGSIRTYESDDGNLTSTFPKFSAAFEDLRQVDEPRKGSVEDYLFQRAGKSVDGDLVESVMAPVIDRGSFVDGKRLAVYVKPSLRPDSDVEDSESERGEDWHIPEKALTLLPEGAQPGDFIAYFAGARVAFIVREVEDPPDVSAPEMYERFRIAVEEKTEVICCEIVGECLLDGLHDLDLEEDWEIVDRPSRNTPSCVFVIS